MARKRRRRSAASNRSSGLPFLGVGLALGLAVAAGVYFSDMRSGAGLPRPPDSRTAAPPAASSAERERSGAAGGSDAPGRDSNAAARTSGAAAQNAAAAAQNPGGAALNPGAAAQTEETAAASRTGEAPAGRSDEPRFDFYEILPRYEVLVPGTERVAAPAAPAEPVSAPGSYVLQTGSFRSYADADRRQAGLALLGIESRIQTVSIDGVEFHRVRIGPISDLGELDRVRRMLREAGVESLMMTVE